MINRKTSGYFLLFTQSCLTLCDSVDCSTPGFPVHYQLLEFASEKAMAPHSSTFAWWIPWTEEPGGLPSMGSHRVGHDQSDLAAAELAQTHVHGVVMPSNHLILCRPLFLPSVFPSIRVFSNKSILRIRWPKYWSFSFSVSPSNEYSGLISLRIDWFDLLAVLRTLKSLSSSQSLLLLCYFIHFMLMLCGRSGSNW